MMQTRTPWLISTIKGMFAILIAAFLFILVRSIGGHNHTSRPSKAFDDVAYGQTAMRRWQQ